MVKFCCSEPPSGFAKWSLRLLDRFEFIFTPKNGSLLNMAEIELHVLTGQCLNRHLSSIEKSKMKLMLGRITEIIKRVLINCQFTTKDARIKLKRLYTSIDD